MRTDKKIVLLWSVVMFFSLAMIMPCYGQSSSSIIIQNGKVVKGKAAGIIIQNGRVMVGGQKLGIIIQTGKAVSSGGAGFEIKDVNGASIIIQNGRMVKSTA